MVFLGVLGAILMLLGVLGLRADADGGVSVDGEFEVGNAFGSTEKQIDKSWSWQQIGSGLLVVGAMMLGVAVLFGVLI